jgi:hypothetical protein
VSTSECGSGCRLAVKRFALGPAGRHVDDGFAEHPLGGSEVGAGPRRRGDDRLLGVDHVLLAVQNGCRADMTASDVTGQARKPDEVLATLGEPASETTRSICPRGVAGGLADDAEVVTASRRRRRCLRRRDRHRSVLAATWRSG